MGGVGTDWQAVGIAPYQSAASAAAASTAPLLAAADTQGVVGSGDFGSPGPQENTADGTMLSGFPQTQDVLTAASNFLPAAPAAEVPAATLAASVSLPMASPNLLPHG
jgi:hypothetical protein